MVNYRYDSLEEALAKSHEANGEGRVILIPH